MPSLPAGNEYSLCGMRLGGTCFRGRNACFSGRTHLFSGDGTSVLTPKALSTRWISRRGRKNWFFPAAGALACLGSDGAGLSMGLS